MRPDRQTHFDASIPRIPQSNMKWIEIKNAHTHNLKHLDVKLAQRSLVVFSGVSGSGKSSLAFDTLFIEGQRRYVESLSPSVRKQLQALEKPAVDSIQGLSPTLSIEQKSVGKNPRSTVGTLTEIHDYLRLLYAKVSTARCPLSKEPLKIQTPSNIAQQVARLTFNRCLLLAPHVRNKRGNLRDEIEHLKRSGYTRARLDGKIVELDTPGIIDPHRPHDLDILVDRLSLKSVDHKRLLESVTNALHQGEGICIVCQWEPEQKTTPSNDESEVLYAIDRYSPKSGKSYPPLHPHDFSHNSPAGMCLRCQGLGISQDWDLNRALTPSRSIAQDPFAIATSYQTVRYRNIFDNLANFYNFDVHTPWQSLDAQAQKIYLHGADRPWITMQFVHPVSGKRWMDRVQWKGILQEAWDRYQGYKTQRAKQQLGQYLIETLCPECQGTRIRPYPRAALLGELSLPDLCQLSIEEMLNYIGKVMSSLVADERLIAASLVAEIERRLTFLREVGLGYLQLDRPAPTLSGGESQRVRLASQVGCGLVGMTYILDEPSIGLHPVDNAKLIQTLRHLRDQGNTVIVVEHDDDTICAADQIVDFGPGAGTKGGQILFSGGLAEFLDCSESLTAQYLNSIDKHLLPPTAQPTPKQFLTLEGVRHRNLQGATIHIPLHRLCAIAGVSGSGKSTLIFDVLYPALARVLATRDLPTGHFRSLKNWESIDRVICIDQNPIGRLPRSNPATYTKVFDDIRQIFAELPQSRALGFKPGRFSFNVAEGSCPHCQGMGWIEIDMEFVAKEYTLCATCQGQRFDEQTLTVMYREKSIADVLNLTVGEAIAFFDPYPQLQQKLKTLQKVGLDYLKLGQPSPQLSGGEAQRIKLAKELAKPPQKHTLYLLDEPTTGLHNHDAMGLLRVLRELVHRGHTVLVIEHHVDVFRNADWIVELGPCGGPQGGRIIAAGTPAKIARQDTPTGKVLTEKKGGLPHRAPSASNEISSETSDVIIVEGARQNNLKNLSISLPRNRLIACVGPSGSGKSSFAFETLYAEGQRRYIESLSPYARQFVQQLPRPHVDRIEGLSPAIAIEQKRHAGNPRSTVGTLTELYDLLRLLFARMGTAHCPDSGVALEVMTPQKLAKQLQQYPSGEKIQILAPVALRRDETIQKLLLSLLRGGFARVRIDGEITPLDFSMIEALGESRDQHQLEVVIDRLVVGGVREERWIQSIEQALALRSQRIAILRENGACDWIHMGFSSPVTSKSYPPIHPKLLSFNHADGQCSECEGLGTTTGILFDRHLPTNAITVQTLLALIWGKEGLAQIAKVFEPQCQAREFTLKTKLGTLSNSQKSWLFGGDRESNRQWSRNSPSFQWRGLYATMARLAKSGAVRLRLILGKYLETIACPVCRGGRLNLLALNVRIEGVNLPEVCSWSILRLRAFLKRLNVSQERGKSLFQVYNEILARADFLARVGLEYLSLDRSAPTLSNGEAQRIRLSAQLGSQLTGVLYVLDEPSAGLHPFDGARLGTALINLRDLGNTLLIVEHNLELMRLADHILEFGPGAGSLGGELIARGTVAEISANDFSPTGRYLTGRERMPMHQGAQVRAESLKIRHAIGHNLKGFSAQIPTPSLTCFTGVSGSGKSTLMKRVLFPAFSAHQNAALGQVASRELSEVQGMEQFRQCFYIDQNPLAKSHRVDVGSYVEVLGKMRNVFASSPEAKLLGLTTSHFSPNTARGMCKLCQGCGHRRIDLRFMAPLTLPCGECRGQRLNPLSLSVIYKAKSFGQLFDMTIAECAAFFADHNAIRHTLDTLQSVGLEYLKLGQNVGTLSGGEAQRLKLSEQLRKKRLHRVLYLLDEPTIGLHPSDVRRLIGVLRALVAAGHTVVCIEHNPHLIQSADWIIDLGPGPGEWGGELVAQGTVMDIAQCEQSKTGQYLKPYLDQSIASA